MKLLTLSDSELAVHLAAVKAEAGRRAKLATADAGGIIKGQEMAKRATLVAAAGGHSILYVGPPGTGKTMLRALALELGLAETFEARPCPCGFCSDPRSVCKCTPAKIDKHVRKLPVADIVVECPGVPERMMQDSRPGTTAAELRDAINRMAPAGKLELDPYAAELLRHAVSDHGMTAHERTIAVAVATTVARLDNAKRIESSHICEAINYRPLAYMRAAGVTAG